MESKHGGSAAAALAASGPPENELKEEVAMAAKPREVADPDRLSGDKEMASVDGGVSDSDPSKSPNISDTTGHESQIMRKTEKDADSVTQDINPELEGKVQISKNSQDVDSHQSPLEIDKDTFSESPGDVRNELPENAHNNTECVDRKATDVSVESSEAFTLTENGGGSETRAVTFVSVDEAELARTRDGAVSKGDPLVGTSLVGTDGSLRHLSPHGIDNEQYYPTVTKEEAGQKQEKDGARETEEKSQISGAASVDKLECESEVFATQVSEETILAARGRLRVHDIFLPEVEAKPRPTLSEIIEERVQDLFLQALGHLNDNEFEKAIPYFNRAIHLNPKEPLLYAQRGECFLQLCDFQSAILNYKRVCFLDPESTVKYNRLAFIYYFQGQCLFDQRLYPEALEAFSRAAEMRPEVIGYHTRSIACLAALQRHGECLALVNKRLEVEQRNADLFVLRARLHRLFRNATLCYYDVKDALALEPGHTQALALMAALEGKAEESREHAVQLSLLGRHRDALQKISVAIESNPAVAEYHNLRGAIHRRLGDFNAAIDDYLLALDKTDHDENTDVYTEAQRQLLLTYNDFAVECFSKGFYEEAILLLNKAIKGEKREKGLYINRGDCFFREGTLQFALADYRQALEIDPVDSAIHARMAVVHNEYGIAEFQDKNYREAEVRFSQAIEHNPGVGQYYISRCRTRITGEDLSSARQDALTALLLDPTNPDIMTILTRLFPGKSVKEVLQSRAASAARDSLQNVVAMATPTRPLPPIAAIAGQQPDVTSQGDVTSSGAVAKSREALKRQGARPDLKTCMEEQEFNLKMAMEKKKVNHRVKDVLLNRESLRHVGGRVRPLPPQGSYSKDTVAVKKATGWRNFGTGIGVQDGAN